MESPVPAHRQETAEAIYDPERDGRMEAEGDISVLGALTESAQAVRDGKESGGKRIVLFILPEAMRGAYGGRQVTALHDAGLTDGFTAVIGISTGAPTGAYLLAGNPRTGNIDIF